MSTEQTKKTNTNTPKAITLQARRIRWQHGASPQMARLIAELHYGGKRHA